MKIARELEQLCLTCINHFDELDLDSLGRVPKVENMIK